MRAVRAGGGDRVEGDVGERHVALRRGLARGIAPAPSPRRSRSACPAALVSMKRRKRSIATPSRRCAARAAGELGGALPRLRQGDRVGALDDRAAGLLDEARDRLGRAVLVVEDLAPARAERREAAREKSRASRTSATASSLSRTAFESFRPSMKSSGRPVGVDDGEGERRSGVCGTSPPRMLKSQAIEAGSVRIAASARFSAISLAISAIFSPTGLPASASGCSLTCASGGCGPVAPDRVDRILRRPARARRRPPPAPWRSGAPARASSARVVADALAGFGAFAFSQSATEVSMTGDRLEDGRGRPGRAPAACSGRRRRSRPCRRARRPCRPSR